MIAIAEALQETFRALDLVDVLLGEPTSFHSSHPLGYILFETSTVTNAGQRSVRRPRLLLRILVPSQEYTVAEQLILSLADPVIAAVESDPTLGGLISSGILRVTDQRGVWVTIAGTTYRALDSFVETVNKVAYGS